MTLNELRGAKERLDADLLARCEEFRRATGCTVVGVDVRVVEFATLGNPRPAMLIESLSSEINAGL